MGIVHEAVVFPYPNMTWWGTCLASPDTLLIHHSYELCHSEHQAGRTASLGTLMTPGMTHGLESQRGTQPATPGPSERAVSTSTGVLVVTVVPGMWCMPGTTLGIRTPYKPCGTPFRGFPSF